MRRENGFRHKTFAIKSWENENILLPYFKTANEKERRKTIILYSLTPFSLSLNYYIIQKELLCRGWVGHLFRLGQRSRAANYNYSFSKRLLRATFQRKHRTGKAGRPASSRRSACLHVPHNLYSIFQKSQFTIQIKKHLLLKKKNPGRTKEQQQLRAV